MIPLFLSLVAGLLSLFPLIVSPHNPFFDVDPEVMYVSNAVSYINHQIITYTDHPGTPYIILIAWALTPLRLVAKYISHQPFVDWYLLNIDFVYSYVRLLALAIFVTAIFLLLRAVKKYTASNLAVITTWIVLISYPEMLSFGVRVMPETFSLFLLSIWIYFLGDLVTTQKYWKLLPLAFIGGAALGNKYTNLVLAVTPTIYFLFLGRRNYNEKIIRRLFILTIVILVGFLSATWAIKGSYMRQVNWVVGIATHSGLYGEGEKSFFDKEVYFESLKGLLVSLRYYWALVSLSAIYLWFSKTKFNSRRALILLTLSASVAVALVFAKMPKLHYQLASLILPLTLSIYVFRRRPVFLLAISIFFLFLLPRSINSHWRLAKHIEKIQLLRTFADVHPAKVKTLWDWSYSREQAVFWGYEWSGRYYQEQLNRLYPKAADMMGFDNLTSRTYCWDQAYVRDSALSPIFLANPDNDFVITKILGTDMNLIETRHCLN